MDYSSSLLSSLAAAANGVNGAGLGGATSAPRRSEVVGLPKGWIREETPRFDPAQFLNGLGSGGATSAAAAAAAVAAATQPEVVYYSPKGNRVRSKAEMARLLGDQYDLTAFDFQTGKINPLLLRSLGGHHLTGTASPSSNRSHSSNQHHHHHHSSSSSHHSSSAAAAGSGGGGGHHHHHSQQSSRKQATTNHVPSGGRNGHTSSQASNKDNSSLSSSSARGRNTATTTAAAAAASDPSLVPPIRQTASIFKQPVTVVRNRESEVKFLAKNNLW